MRTRILLPALSLVLAAASCGTDPGVDYDQTALDSYRSAIPSESRLTAATPQDSAGRAGNALIANFGADLTPLNDAVRNIIQTMRDITDLPPTHFDSDSGEFLWGPGDNPDGYGQVLAYIVKHPDGSDFEYGYALLRTTADGDLANVTPVIWGGATPHATDETKGVGVTLWDLEANHDFEAAHDPNYDAAAPRATGRFAALYGHIGALAELKFNYAVFRSFRPENATQDINLDVFYGEYTGPQGNVVSFLDWQQVADLCDTTMACFGDVTDPTVLGSTADEYLSIAMAFLNGGIGRGEVTLALGDLDPNTVSIAECWDANVDRNYFAMVNADGTNNTAVAVSTPGCTLPFENNKTLADLQIPSLDSIDADHRASMSCVVSLGVKGCDECREQNGLQACQ